MVLTSQVLLVCCFSMEVMGNAEDVNGAGDWMGARDMRDKVE